MTAAKFLSVFLRAENLEALHERQAGVDHHGELPREDREVLGRRGFGPRLLRRRRGLGLRRGDAGDEHLLAPQRRHDRVHRVADALAVDGFAAARAAGKSKSRHACPYRVIGRGCMRPAVRARRPARRRRRG